jgi:hypothetical protein
MKSNEGCCCWLLQQSLRASNTEFFERQMRDKSFDICSPDIQIRRLLLQKFAILGKNKQRQETSWEHENRIHQTNKERL